MSNIDATLEERGSRYGEFEDHALVTQNIKRSMYDTKNWAELDDDKAECLEMVAHKIGRILNGDSDYVDSWTDIIGYVRLVEKRLIAEQAEPPAQRPSSIADILGVLRKVATEAPCTDPKCPEHNPEIREAIEVLRKAGVIVHT